MPILPILCVSKTRMKEYMSVDKSLLRIFDLSLGYWQNKAGVVSKQDFSIGGYSGFNETTKWLISFIN